MDNNDKFEALMNMAAELNASLLIWRTLTYYVLVSYGPI